jgi:hypothetical protein
MSKICKKCSLEQDISQFYPRKDGGFRGECLSCRSLYVEQNKEKRSLQGRDRYQKHKKEVLIKSAERYNDNKEIIIKKNVIYKRQRRQFDICFKIAEDLRSRLNHAIRNCFKSGSAVSDLGCSIEELKVHLESKFKPSMTWENRGFNGWHIDHIRPLSSFNLSNRDELLLACNYKNLQPLWAKDNLSKGSKYE